MLFAFLIGVAAPVAVPQQPESVDSPTSRMLTPDDRLFRAIREGDPDGVSGALQAGADPNASHSPRGTALNHAASYCLLHEEAETIAVVQTLIDAGADPHIRDENGVPPLNKAAGWGCSFLFQVFVDAGADPNTRDPQGRTSLHRAVEYGGDAEFVQLLIDAGANVNARHIYRRTPLFYADTAELVRTLIGAGADPNAQDGDGSTPLHDAAFHCWPEAAQALIEAGANVNARMDSSPDDAYWGGNTPLHYAACSDTVWVLFDAGANPNARNERGETPADSVARMDFMDGYEEAAQLLRRMAGE